MKLSRKFTVIEVFVVIAILATLFAIVRTAMQNRSNPDIALQNAKQYVNTTKGDATYADRCTFSPKSTDTNNDGQITVTVGFPIKQGEQERQVVELECDARNENTGSCSSASQKVIHSESY
jgi:type II secretory pathway pseudopilin PulG